jgi:hypothetical protein
MLHSARPSAPRCPHTPHDNFLPDRKHHPHHARTMDSSKHRGNNHRQIRCYEARGAEIQRPCVSQHEFDRDCLYLVHLGIREEQGGCLGRCSQDCCGERRVPGPAPLMHVIQQSYLHTRASYRVYDGLRLSCLRNYHSQKNASFGSMVEPWVGIIQLSN